jgi:hypothetical protein
MATRETSEVVTSGVTGREDIPPCPARVRHTFAVGAVIRRGSERITTMLVPAMRVVREPGQLPRVEWISNGEPS